MKAKKQKTKSPEPVLKRLSIFIIALTLISFCRTILYAQDTLAVLKLEDLYLQMMRNHPVVKQAQLLPLQARQEIRISRAGFEPKLNSQLAAKKYGGKEYYNIWENSLKIPTWFGVEFKAGYDEASGYYLNPERTLPSNGLAYAGVTLPLGAGLVIDQRRATLRQAQLLQKINDAEKVKTINKIFYEAAKDYWEWYFQYQRYKYVERGYQLALDRYHFVKKRVDLGEEAAIDSTEALILLQLRIVTYGQAEIDVKNALLRLSNHLWTDNDVPLEFDNQIAPETFNLDANKITLAEIQSLTSYAQSSHPDLLKIDNKIKQLNIDRRLAVENFKPLINLNYNLIHAGYNPVSDISQNYMKNNYKAGFEISFPLFLRKERGKLQLTKFKIKQTDFERNFTARQISNQIMQFYNELVITERLLESQFRLINNYVVMKNGEFEKFNNGESSLFLVNTRETSLIDTQIKLAEMEAKYEKAKAGLYWSAGKMEFD